MLENWGQRLSPTEIRASQMWTRVKVTSFRRLGQRGQVTGGNGHCLPPPTLSAVNAETQAMSRFRGNWPHYCFILL